MKKKRRPLRIGILARILLLNGLIVFLPVAAMLLLDTYEQQLLDSLERSLVQQGRMLAASLSLEQELTPAAARELISALEGRHEARIRVLDGDGMLLADSATVDLTSDGPVARSISPADPEPDAADPAQPVADPRDTLLYRVASFPVRAVRSLMGSPEPALSSADFYTTADYPNGSEVQAALEGRYGAATRVSAGGQISVTLYSAIPIIQPGSDSGDTEGVVLVSQSTFRILQDMYVIRTDVFRIFLWCLLAAVILSAFLAVTIARPIRVLETRAREAVDERGRLRGPLPTGRRHDEIGALAQSLSELTRQVHRYTRQIEGFAADASHELKNPLASISASCEIAVSTKDPARRAQMLNRARLDVRRAESILAGMRELSHIDAGTELSGQAEVIPILENAVAELAAQHPGHEVRFEQDGLPPQALVGLRPERLYQIVTNLVGNSASIAPSGSLITVKVEASRSSEGRPRVVLTVSDEGPGIEEPERIFDRFYSARPEKGEHLGLGLSVVKAIVESAGGTVGAMNGTDTSGAIIRVDLPQVT
jgi:two-component system sensor histidine kinase ChvG